MGCQTGFYFSLLCRDGHLLKPEELCPALEGLCARLRDYKEVPHANERDCGNYRSFDLAAARELCEGIRFAPFAAV